MVSERLYPCMFCVSLSIDLFVFSVECLNCLVKQFAIICLGVVILLLNVMELFSMVGVICWIDHLWSSKQFVCCACDLTHHTNTQTQQ